MTGGADEAARLGRMIDDAVSRGQRALSDGDAHEGARWLDRAHRLSHGNPTIALMLASALVNTGDIRAVRLFRAVLAIADLREAWLGLAAFYRLVGNKPAARLALAGALRRNAPHPGFSALSDAIAREAGAIGWCGLTGDGLVTARTFGDEPLQIRLDGVPVTAPKLPETWWRSAVLTVKSGRRHLIGSPLSPSAIGRLEGFVEAIGDEIQGWAWYPGDPDRDPILSISAGDRTQQIIASSPATGVEGLVPLARPRAFRMPKDRFIGKPRVAHVRGRDGQALAGSPVALDARPPPAQANEAPPTPDLTLWPSTWERPAIIVTHDDGGGVERRVQATVAHLRRRGRHAIVLRPARTAAGGTAVRVTDGWSGRFPDMRFALPKDQGAVARLLQGAAPAEVIVHHLLNHDRSVTDIIRGLGVPYDVHAHDYIWFCPRIALVGRGGRYCGEPAPKICTACVKETGTFLHESVAVPTLIARSRAFLRGARQVFAPSHDAAGRMIRHFPGLPVQVAPHENDRAVPEPPPVPVVTGTLRVCLAGAFGTQKGYDVLLAQARDARDRGLDLEFRVVGTTINDERLMETGRVFVTGRYDPSEARGLIRAQNAQVALLPSIWPETWCLTLTELWRSGLRVAAFDIGAQAERIRATGRGILLPRGLPAGAINDALLNWTKGRSFLPIRVA